MKKLHVILDLYKIENELNSLTNNINTLSCIIKENPEIASIEIGNIFHFTIEDIIDIISEQVNDMASIVKNGTVREY